MKRFLIVAVVLCSVGLAQESQSSLNDPLYPWMGNAGYNAEDYDIALRLSSNHQRLEEASNTMTATALTDLPRFNLDLGYLEVRGVDVNGAPATFVHQDPELTITPAAPIAKGSRFTVTVRYDGLPGSRAAEELQADYSQSWLATPESLLVISEPSLMMTWAPVNDYPGDKATFTLSITAPLGPTLISNGTLQYSRRDTSTNTITKIYRFATPTTTYMPMFALDDASLTVNPSVDGVRIRHYLSPRTSPVMREAIEETGEMLRFFNAKLGAYPFEQYGVFTTANIRGYALETQTLSSAALGYGLSPSLHHEILAHELAHQWFGGLVSMKDHAQMWLQEGFAQYLGWVWTQQRFPTSGGLDRYIQIRHNAFKNNLPRGCTPPGKLKKGDDPFNGCVYIWGAFALHALQKTLGENDFYQTLRDFLAANRFGAATVQDFVSFVSARHGDAAKTTLERWLYSSTMPELP